MNVSLLVISLVKGFYTKQVNVDGKKLSSSNKVIKDKTSLTKDSHFCSKRFYVSIHP